MNNFVKTLTGTLAVFLFHATALPAAESGPIYLAMANENIEVHGCNPGTFLWEQGDSWGCTDPGSGGGGIGGGGGPGPVGGEGGPYGGGGAGGGGSQGSDKPPSKPPLDLAWQEQNCARTHGKWYRYRKDGTNHGALRYKCKIDYKGGWYDSYIYNKLGETVALCKFTLGDTKETCIIKRECRGDASTEICDDPNPT